MLGVAQASASAAAANETAAALERQRQPRHSAEPEPQHDRQGRRPAPASPPRRSRLLRTRSARGSLQQPMRAVAGQDRAERADQKRRVGRPAVEADAGQQGVEARGTPACTSRARRADATAAAQAKKRISRAHSWPRTAAVSEQQERDGADVELAHVLGDEEPRIGPGEARRPPVVLHAARGAEHVRHHQRQQQGRMQRAARRRRHSRSKAGSTPAASSGRQQHGHGDDRQRADRAGAERQQARAHGGARPLRATRCARAPKAASR